MALSMPFTNRRLRPDDDDIIAGMELDLAKGEDRAYVDGTVARSKMTSRKPWEWYKKIGEVRYSVQRAARVAGFAKIVVEKRVPARDGKPERWERLEVNSNSSPYDQLAVSIANGIYSPWHGTRGLIQRFYGHMKVPGDSYLVRIPGDSGMPGDYDGYCFISSSEIDQTANLDVRAGVIEKRLRWITLPGGAGAATSRATLSPFERWIEPEDFLGRVWSPGMEFVDEAESPLMAVETECDVLHKLTLTLKAKLLQRLALAGILYIPSEITAARARTKDKPAATVDDLLTYLVDTMTQNVRTFEDASAYAPILMRGPGSVAEQLKHITIDREIFETDIKLRRELIERILFAMDSNQKASGGESTNHWDSWFASEDEVRLSVSPDLDNATFVMQRVVFNRQMLSAQVPPEQVAKYRLAWDLTGATIKTNKAEDLRQLRDRGGIDLPAMRRLVGVDEADALEDDELVRWIGRELKNPYLATYGLPEQAGFDWEKITPPKQNGPDSGKTGEDPSAGPGVGNPGSPDDEDRSTGEGETP